MNRFIASVDFSTQVRSQGQLFLGPKTSTSYKIFSYRNLRKKEFRCRNLETQKFVNYVQAHCSSTGQSRVRNRGRNPIVFRARFFDVVWGPYSDHTTGNNVKLTNKHLDTGDTRTCLNQDSRNFKDFIIKVCELILKQWNSCEMSTLVVFNGR